jgi:hypothetical protein
MGGIVGAVARSGEQFRMTPDATGIRQTHWMKSICYSSHYCSSVGFAPPPGHYGLAAHHRRHAQSPMLESLLVTRCLGRLVTPPAGRLPRSATCLSCIASLGGISRQSRRAPVGEA